MLKSGGRVYIDKSLKYIGDMPRLVSFFSFVRDLRRFELLKLLISMFDSHLIDLSLKFVTLI